MAWARVDRNLGPRKPITENYSIGESNVQRLGYCYSITPLVHGHCLKLKWVLQCTRFEVI